MTQSQAIVLPHLIEAKPVAGDFSLQQADLPALIDGDLLVRVIYLSLDPYIGTALRGRHMTPQPSPGDVVPGGGSLRSLNPNLQISPLEIMCLAKSAGAITLL
nr:hypothetical protein [Parasphingorhabdus halotolerans]